MKNRLWILLPVFLVFLLSGCECDHEWVPADCTNPQTCANCGEPGEPALGHNWADAECEISQTCRRCSETQGEPLGHRYGDWTFTESEMTRVCTVCGAEDTTELDRAVYLESLLSGCWEFTALFHGDEIYTGYQFSFPSEQLFFGEGHSVTGLLNHEPCDRTWEFQKFVQEDGHDNYYFSLVNAEGKALTSLLSRRSEQDNLYLFFNQEDQVILRRHDDVATALEGTWGAEGGMGMCNLNFNKDRTVSGNIDGEFTGTWQLMDVMDLDHTRYCGLYICFERNGEKVVLKGTVMPDSPYSETAEEENDFIPETIRVTYNNSLLSFVPMTQEEIDSKDQILSEGPNMLIGTWSSYCRRDISKSSPVNTNAMEYSVTFHIDGTFTASMGRELTGTWIFEDAHGNSNGSSGSYSYYLYINETDTHQRASIEFTQDHASKLFFSVGKSGSPESKVNHYFFKISTKEMDQLEELICGTWTSTDMEYRFSFERDGSFTGFDGTDLNGSWSIINAWGNEESAVIIIEFHPKGQTESEWFRIYYHSSDKYDTSADITYTPKGNNQSPSFRKYSQELIESAAQAPTYPIGEWISTAVSWYGENEDTVQKETDAYTFTIREDGTITAQLVNGTVDGTWSLKSISDSGYYYSFEYPGMPEYGPREFYVSTTENFMSYRVDDGENGTFYQLRRK